MLHGSDLLRLDPVGQVASFTQQLVALAGFLELLAAGVCQEQQATVQVFELVLLGADR